MTRTLPHIVGTPPFSASLHPAHPVRISGRMPGASRVVTLPNIGVPHRVTYPHIRLSVDEQGGNNLKGSGRIPEIQGQNLDLTVLCVPYSPFNTWLVHSTRRIHLFAGGAAPAPAGGRCIQRQLRPRSGLGSNAKTLEHVKVLRSCWRRQSGASFPPALGVGADPCLAPGLFTQLLLAHAPAGRRKPYT